jgi:hypothetical protein
MESIVKVQFRKFKGEIIAVFPYIIETSTNIMCYAHIGQHSSCIWSIDSFSKPAKPEEYKDLLSELQSIGYNVQVINRRSHKEYLHAYYDSINPI